MTNASTGSVIDALRAFGMARDRLRAALSTALGVGTTDIEALEYLELLGPLTQRDLGTRLVLTSGAVTLLVDRLERLGAVRRGPHPHDRRATLVSLSPDHELPDVPAMREYHARVGKAAA